MTGSSSSQRFSGFRLEVSCANAVVKAVEGSINFIVPSRRYWKARCSQPLSPVPMMVMSVYRTPQPVESRALVRWLNLAICPVLRSPCYRKVWHLTSGCETSLSPSTTPHLRLMRLCWQRSSALGSRMVPREVQVAGQAS